MSRVLFAWELGAHLGHLARDLPLARRCRDEGADLVFAVPVLRVAVGQAGEVRLPFVWEPARYPAIRWTASPVRPAYLILCHRYDNRDAPRWAFRGRITTDQPSLFGTDGGPQHACPFHHIVGYGIVR